MATHAALISLFGLRKALCLTVTSTGKLGIEMPHSNLLVMAIQPLPCHADGLNTSGFVTTVSMGLIMRRTLADIATKCGLR